MNQFLFYTGRLEWTERILMKNLYMFTLPDLALHNYYYYRATHTVYYETSPELRRDGAARLRHSATLPYLCSANPELYTRKLSNPLNQFSIKKTKVAAYVNIIHALDASYLRLIVEGCHQAEIPLIAIHDGFGVPYNQAHNLVNLANKCFTASLLEIDDAYINKPALGNGPMVIDSTTTVI